MEPIDLKTATIAEIQASIDDQHDYLAFVERHLSEQKAELRRLIGAHHLALINDLPTQE